MFTPLSDPTAPNRLRLGFAGPGDESGDSAVPHLSVDGMTPVGPNLSHWPGNRTPAEWKADLSTGICLRFARATPERQEQFLGDAQVVLNDHYDTDGFGSLLSVMRPDLAFKHEDLLLAAAATGDFGVFGTWRGFAVDRIVTGLLSERSPVRGAFTPFRDSPDIMVECYRWLIEHGDSVLANIGSYRAIYEDEMRLVQEQIDAGLRGDLDRRAFAEIGFCAITSDGERHRMTLNTLAGAYRVLHVNDGKHGPLFRYHDRTESWFELVTMRPLPRHDLRPLAAQLAELEPEHDGASWNADPPTAPIPELFFGVPSEQEYGEITRELRPSKLSRDQVSDAFAKFFANAHH